MVNMLDPFRYVELCIEMPIRVAVLIELALGALRLCFLGFLLATL